MGGRRTASAPPYSSSEGRSRTTYLRPPRRVSLSRGRSLSFYCSCTDATRRLSQTAFQGWEIQFALGGFRRTTACAIAPQFKRGARRRAFQGLGCELNVISACGGAVARPTSRYYVRGTCLSCVLCAICVTHGSDVSYASKDVEMAQARVHKHK
jgi:hypothetical protein